MAWGATFSREGKTRDHEGYAVLAGSGGSLTFAGGIQGWFGRKGGVTRWPRPPAK